MRNIILMLMLSLVSSNAMAEWIEVGRYGDMTLYVDYSTIRKHGNLVKMWSLIDRSKFDTVDNKQYKSVKQQWEFNCVEEQNRMLYASYHTGNMGKGEVFDVISEPSEMMPIPPNSGNEIQWNIACSKK